MTPRHAQYALVERGETRRNREGAATRTTRRWKRIMGPSTWFKGGKKRPRDDEGTTSGVKGRKR